MWFGCSVNNIQINEPIQYGLFEEIKDKAHGSLDSFLDKGGVISGKKIMESYFPAINADIFISHSHKDFELAKSLAGELHQKLGIVSFIDSMVWGYSDDLLKRIDDEYCRNCNNNNYSYERRNLSTSYVHMMLAKSLADMMDKCACLFFINTDQSIRTSEIEENKETFSPWIFYELDIFHKIEKRRKQQINFSQRIRTGAIDKIANESLEIALLANMKELKPVNADLIKKWVNGHKTNIDAITELYELVAPKIISD